MEVQAENKMDIKEKITNDKWKIVISNSAWHSIGEQIKFPKIIEKEKTNDCGVIFLLKYQSMKEER